MYNKITMFLSDISNTKSPVRDFIERPQVDEKISNSLEQNRIAFITGKTTHCKPKQPVLKMI